MADSSIILKTPAPAQTPNSSPAAAPTVPPQEAPQVDPKVSSRFASLSRKERLIVQKQHEVQTKEAALAAREKAIAEREESFEKAWKTDPTKAAESRGLTYAEWTNRVLNDGKPSPESEVSSVREDLAKLRKEREDEKKASEQASLDAQKAANAKVIADFKEGVKEFIKGKAEDYELVNLHDAHGLVIATIEEHFEQTKQILDTKEACDLVEKFLEEQVIKSTETKRIKARVSPQPEGEPKSTSKGASTQQKTLTNEMTSSAPGYLPAKTENDRIKRALAALERTK